MEEMILKHSSKLYLPSDSEEVKRFLTFRDRSVDYQIKRIKQNVRWRRSNPESFLEKVEELKSQINKCLIFYDDQGRPYTYAGLYKDLEDRFGWKTVNTLKDPYDDKIIPWAQAPKPIRYYQAEAAEALIKARHGSIELPTGSGKSRLIFELCKRLPVQTVITTPAASITDQLYQEFVYLFGKKYVGKYGDGKKELGKLFTVATAQALVRVEPGTEEFDFLSKTQSIIWDESHTTPAETFEKVAMNVLKDAYYRFFVSATQLRTDGSEMILKGITGPIVYSKNFKELVEEGFLARPFFKIFKVPAKGLASSMDPNEETRNQLYLNSNVNSLAGQLAEKAVNLLNRQTVILIDEFSQFMQLKNYITVPFEFAHGGITNRLTADKKNLKDVIPEQYWKSDIQGIVDRFNRGETKLIIGTSAISTGVDLQPTGCLIYLQGGTSEIQVKQGIGRSTRVTENKKDAYIFDFKVMGSAAMERHCDARIKIYETLGEVQEIG
jgi:superfamily II DNA or RNA helicase